MKDIKLTLTIDEVNQILEALGNQPFVKVHSLIQKIQQQGSSQIESEAVTPQESN